MSQVIITGILSAAVADAGTFTAAYPSRPSPDAGFYNEGDFHLGVAHKLVMGGTPLESPQKFGVAIDGTNITVTNKTGAAWAAGSTWYLEMQTAGKGVYRDDVTGARINRMGRADTFVITLGAPDTADADGVCASQGVTGGAAALINGALASGGVATFDVPRNVVGAWTNTSVLTVRGKDEYGQTVVESSASGTSMTGKKAFKTITSATFSATVTGATVGTGDVLGLPVFLPQIGQIVAEMQDAAVASAGTAVAGLTTAGGSTATTGDVRGTYDPSAACNGEINFSLLVALPDPGYLGPPQYAG